ncbi:3-keto-disaccharide hydrolase [Parapedobacter sp.]
MLNLHQLHRSLLVIGSVSLSVLVSSSCNSGKSQQHAEGVSDSTDYMELFDGSSLTGWRGDTSLWRAEGGALVGEIVAGEELTNNSFIIWDGGLPADFELIAEYRMTGNGNSGINYRSEELTEPLFALKGYQADIDAANTYTGQNYEERGRTILAFPGQYVRLPEVSGPISDYAKGNIWTAGEEVESLGERDSLRMVIKQNDWNEIRIVAKGNQLEHYINGTLMSKVVDDDVANRKFEGALGFQVHVGPPMKIEYRNIRLKNLD